MDKELRNTILEAMEKGLEAQARAVRRLRKSGKIESAEPAKKRRSQVDMAYDILVQSHEPLHITALLERIHHVFGVRIDRESLA
jgi:hypothetical protein